MSNDSFEGSAPVSRHVMLRPRARVLGYYLMPVFLMIAGWTFIHYVDQPYNSPSYRRSALQCLGYAAWTTPLEGAGPLTPVMLFALARPWGFDLFVWTAPAFGAAIYATVALAFSRLGRRWDPLVHVMIGSAWLLLGAWLFTVLTQK
jgi:hypothetical protein